MSRGTSQIAKDAFDCNPVGRYHVRLDKQPRGTTSERLPEAPPVLASPSSFWWVSENSTPSEAMAPLHTFAFATSTPSKTLTSFSRREIVIYAALRSLIMLCLSITTLSPRALIFFLATREQAFLLKNWRPFC